MADTTSTARRALRKARRYAERQRARRTPADASPTARAAMIGFWTSERTKQSWTQVERQLEALAAGAPDRLESFVRVGLEHTPSAAEIVFLARHPLTAGTVGAWLTERLASADPAGTFDGRDARDAAFVGAARLLLPEADAARLHRLAPAKTTRYYQFLSSLGTRPAGAARKAARHRLIVLDAVTDPAAVALSLPGADEATILVLSDPFGMSDFSKYDSWVGSGEIHVEHTRTRITRFSAAYAGLHEAVARVAERIVAEVAAIPGLLHRDDEPFLVVEVADFLFFHGLKILALDTLLDDDRFDDVVVATGDHKLRSEYALLLADLPRLLVDPRVEFVSVSAAARRRNEFWRLLDTITVPAARPVRASAQLPVELVVSDFSAEARERGGELRWATPEPSDWLLLATIDNPAYNGSTVAYARELLDTRPVRALHTSGPGDVVSTALAAGGLADGVPLAAWDPGPAQDLALTDVLQRVLPPLCRELRASAETEYEAAAAKAFDVVFDRLVSARIVPALLRQKAFEHRFESWRTTGHLPCAVILAPHRDPSVGGLAAVARRMGVPSVALEPHMQDANYSRYLKIAADYYGVFSRYFVENATSAFGVRPDRVRALGTPRLVAPADYDRAAARREARAALTAETGFDFTAAPLHVVFFGQPSSWHQLERVWTMVVDAARKVGAHVFLKPHPEESPSRIRRYFEDADIHGDAGTVTQLSGTAGDAVDLADIVVTTYSTAAVDAAIRETPVVSVADGDVAYPIDVAAIVDAQTARSVEELAEIFDDLIRDPGPALARARALIEREPYFVTGPGPGLRALIDDVVARGADGLRSTDETPRSLFLDGPHPVFAV